MANVNGRLLESKMVLLGYDKTKLAEKTGINRNTIASVINGKQKPTYRVMDKIYQTLKLTPQEATDIFFNHDLHDMQERKEVS